MDSAMPSTDGVATPERLPAPGATKRRVSELRSRQYGADNAAEMSRSQPAEQPDGTLMVWPLGWDAVVTTTCAAVRLGTVAFTVSSAPVTCAPVGTSLN